MRENFFHRALSAYVVIGGVWCFLVNAGAAITGTPSAFLVLTGGASLPDKIFEVLRALGGQILLWPLDVYDKMGRIAFG